MEPNKYNCCGVCDVVDNHAVRITELPVKSWTSNYKESVLEPYLHGTEKSKPCITYVQLFIATCSLVAGVMYWWLLLYESSSFPLLSKTPIISCSL